LLPDKVIAIVPPPLVETVEEVWDDDPQVLKRWVRGALVAVALGLLTVFGIARGLNPYDENGTPLRMQTHRQLGLPPCTFYDLTHLPCPSCGMTTSFSLLMHGDVVSSLRANAVGTLLALFWMALIPWCLACAVTKRMVLVRSAERAVSALVVGFLGLLLVRWLLVLGLTLWGGTPVRF
jgi:hypothetical protein